MFQECLTSEEQNVFIHLVGADLEPDAAWFAYCAHMKRETTSLEDGEDFFGEVDRMQLSPGRTTSSTELRSSISPGRPLGSTPGSSNNNTRNNNNPVPRSFPTHDDEERDLFGSTSSSSVEDIPVIKAHGTCGAKQGIGFP